MNKKQIIEVLEKRFLSYYYTMDKHAQQKEESNAIRYAVLCCEYASILACINGTTEQRELDRLNKKYNLKNKIYNI